MPIHNKLVRDKIPQIIQEAGKNPATKILSKEEYIIELRKKTQEELTEYLAAASNEEALEELADLLEVIYSLAHIHGESFEMIEELRKQKRIDRGGFDEKIYLIEVENGDTNNTLGDNNEL